MDADLAPYLDPHVQRLQDTEGCCMTGQNARKKISHAARETDALVSDLMVDQPLLWLGIAFLGGLFFGKRLFRGN
ncbi:hypothetical protein [Gluconobacter kanchanaburiensis]|uniref:Uncharacterized protein n=1 Tax=Gluconobacter kanchanaburiensis NBRC 103587 TaxID=1307948 RepID=A0A511B5X0_9PROT|nr:hypothetical protein [Gluconobacter kanchanaburiensis]MBF0861393.1 hypothetical protein [Gluconobacter kanchanaburiensis]GBR68205.1 hypothetical protein AA103587_0684 [Gluconobacter kanchanaburiensis NBRC 103587]GEK95754.1 hypothetical protein GKA01_09510 [Gluconobacter kanchanaburiensis NBRC 103587]